MPVFFISSNVIHGDTITIEGPLFEHLFKSLRIRGGHELVFGDEQRRRYQTHVSKVKKGALNCEILHTQSGPPPPPTQLILGQAILKGHHMTWAIQKATELGVSAIIPLFTDRVVVRPHPDRFNEIQKRWQRIAIDAAQQSERWDTPKVNIPTSLPAFFKIRTPENVGCILTERTDAQGLDSLPLSETFQGKIFVTGGPEGGWTEEERRQADQYDFREISLGSIVFRAETAPLVALTLIQQQLGAFRNN